MKRPRLSPRTGSLAARARRIALRLVVALIAAWATYAILANLALSTPLVRHFTNVSPDVRVEYARAWSWWPGRVRVEHLIVTMQDYNVEARLAVDDAQFDVSLHELAFRRFHASRVRAHGTSFRMRHKVHAVGKDSARLAEYPRIAGFSDPPLYVGPPPPPIPDDQYALWEVKLDDVVATAKELWILEYRYQGAGVATGAFDLRPARFFSLAPSRLELDRGTLSVGGHAVAEQVRLSIGCRVEGHDIRTVEGLAIFRKISAGLHGTLSGGGLDFTDVYLGPHFGARASGSASWKLDADVDAGRVRAGSQIELHASQAAVSTGDLGGQGDVEVVLRAPDERRLLLDARAPELIATSTRNGSSLPPPHAQSVVASVVVSPADLAEEPGVHAASLDVPAFQIPALAWFDTFVQQHDGTPTIGGAASGALAIARTESGALDGRAGLDLDDAWLERGKLRVATTASLRTGIARPSAQRRGFTLEGVRVTLPRLVVSNAGESAKLSAVISSSALRVSSVSPLAMSGGLDVHAEPVDGLLAFLIEPTWLRRLTANALDLDSLDGHVELNLGDQLRRVDVRRARSGKLAIRGHIDAAGAHPRGAFLLSAGTANVGVEIRGGATHTSLLVGDDWLARGRR